MNTFENAVYEDEFEKKPDNVETFASSDFPLYSKAIKPPKTNQNSEPQVYPPDDNRLSVTVV